nr:DUF3180 domain-containing protein [Corynebacterium lactis]
MKPTSPLTLIAVAIVLASASWIVLDRFFAELGPRSWWDLGFLWLLSAVCVAAARWIKKVLSDGRVGQDRSQVHPLTLSRWCVVGSASAWLGAIFAGLYLGGVVWAIPSWSDLAAAESDGPIMVVGFFSGVLLAAAGLWLEKVCQLPSNDEKSPPPTGEMGSSSVGWSYD